jgi:hypothetical protein
MGSALDLFIRFQSIKTLNHLVHVYLPLIIRSQMIAQTWPMGAEIIQPVTRK